MAITDNVKHPGGVSTAVGRQLMSDLQIINPKVYPYFVDKYGSENYTAFLSTYAGMEEVKGQKFSHFESKGKNQFAVTVSTLITAPAAGATVSLTITAGDVQGGVSPLRVGETVRVASSGIEGKVLTVPTATTATIRPLKSTQAFVSAGSANLLANDVILLMGNTEAGERSTKIAAQVPLDEEIVNYVTQIREDWEASDLAEMEEVYYKFNTGGFGIAQAGQSAFTYKGLVRANERFLSNIDFKLMKGDLQTNTGLNAGTQGTQGLIPAARLRSGVVGYTPGSMALADIHTITRTMDVNGSPVQNHWLQDIYQRQEFNDELFTTYSAGGFVWGQGIRSEEASVAYGFQGLFIDGYMFQIKKHSSFNTEVVYGKSVAVAGDELKNFGIIIPQGRVRDARTSQTMNNLTVMYQQPRPGGTIANGIKVWEYGANSPQATTPVLEHGVSMVTYRGLRAAAINQFVLVEG